MITDAANGTRDAVNRLRRLTTMAELVQSTPRTAASMGFDRVILSRIDGSLWITESVFVDADPDWSRRILAAGRDHPQELLPYLREMEALRKNRPIRVSDGQQHPFVHEALAKETRWHSYVVAPVSMRGEAVGMVHADRHLKEQPVDEFDCALLGVFAEALGLALERAVLMKGLSDLRSQITACSEGDLSLAVSWHQAPPLPLHGEPSNFKLTPREIEVLKLMAVGDDNRRIARRLFITEGTVKTHVKSIFRKLAATNRAQAVAVWLQLDHPNRRGLRKAS